MDGRRDDIRKKVRQKAPLETVLTVLGYGLYVVAVLCVVTAIFLITSLDEQDPGFPAGEGFLKAIKGYGVGLFGVGAIVAYFLGRWVLDVRVKGARQAVEARSEASRMATELAADHDFQTAGTLEHRTAVAYSLIPQLREYAESDDWDDRRFADQTIKEAWELHLRSASGT